MSEDQKKQLETQLWNIANTLRGKMNADEFRDYILGFIFYKYLSERMRMYADSLLEADGIKYTDINENTDEGKEYLEAIKEESLTHLGYFLKPSELFSAIAKRGNANTSDEDGESKSNFILEDLGKILTNIEQSTMGTESEDDFDNLFEDLDLSSTKLGRTEAEKNRVISKVLSHLDKIDFHLADASRDVLGDAYEYLIGQFASGAGKKAGEFYTPQAVSKVLAKIVTTGKTKLKTVYDPTCGSGSLLLRVAREVSEVGKFYGQELNRTTYNLARMNMILHGIHYQRFDIRQEDSLERPQHFDLRAEAIVANPPFSAHWTANPIHLGDDRFSQYGKLAPSSKADFAFIQHMIHQLADNGIMAVVVPHGVLFRGGAEAHIRQYLIEDRNYLDAVIGLPANIFYGTSIPTCILVFKKCRENPENILFIDASQHFGKATKQNYLRDADIEKIIMTFRERRAEEKYSYLASLKEIEENDYNLNIPRYVDTFESEEIIDLDFVATHLQKLDEMSKENDKTIFMFCDELNLPKPLGNNLFLLEQYKKGVTQKIFNQEIRFKDDNGNNFVDWERKKLGDFLTESREQGTTGDIAKKLTVKLWGKGVYEKNERLVGSSNTKYCKRRAGQFIYSKLDFLNCAFGIIPNELDGYESTVDLPCFDLSPDLNPIFLLETVKREEFYLKYGMTADGSRKARRIHADIFLDFPIQVPTLSEQKKIANFLTAIDGKINLVNHQLEKTKEYKKGLLQQMFV
jgi:type I restriction enzyme M protein